MLSLQQDHLMGYKFLFKIQFSKNFLSRKLRKVMERNMKLLLLAFLSLFVFCVDPGVTNEVILEKQNLPEQFKNLKIYYVSVGNGSYVYIASLNDAINSVSTTGKAAETVLMFDNGFSSSRREIGIKNIILENDTMIIARKK